MASGTPDLLASRNTEAVVSVNLRLCRVRRSRTGDPEMELGVPLAVVAGCRQGSVGLTEEMERRRESLGGGKKNFRNK
jgi:hypothetical protein